MRRAVVRRSWVALVALSAAVLTGCTSGTGKGGVPDSDVPASGAALSGSTVEIRPSVPPTGAQRSYGTSIGQLPGVTYQPDVVVLGGGASSIRSVDSTGYVWTIDGSAPGADRLHVGSVLVATTLATGKVLAVKDVAGGEKQVVLGPAALTDVIQQGRFSTGGAVPIANPLFYSFPGDPAASQPVADSDPSHVTHDAGYHRLAPDGAHSRKIPVPSGVPTSIPTGGVPTSIPTGGIPTGVPSGVPTSIPSGATASDSSKGTLPGPDLRPPDVHEGSFDFEPQCCAGGAGVKITYNSPYGRMVANVGLDFQALQLSASIDIDRNGIVDANVSLTGAAAIYYNFDAATLNVKGDVPHRLFDIPVNIQIPATPFAISLRQDVSMSIQLAGQANLSSHAKYTMTGKLGFGYTRGQGFHDYKPHFAVAQSVMDNALSLGVSVNALALTYHGKLTMGFGIPGVTVGPFVGVDAALAMAKDGSPPQTSLKLGCVIAALVVTGNYGIGYVINSTITKVINFFLTALNARPIAPEGGLKSDPFPLYGEGPSQRCASRK